VSAQPVWVGVGARPGGWHGSEGSKLTTNEQAQSLIADLKGNFAFHDVEPFLLRIVQVKRRAFAWLEIAVFDDEEVAGGVVGDNLEGQRTEAECVWKAEAILPGGDGMERGRRRRRGLSQDIVKGSDRERRRGGLEEAAALQAPGGNDTAAGFRRDSDFLWTAQKCQVVRLFWLSMSTQRQGASAQRLKTNLEKVEVA
jgi:hypothetical protein